MFSDRFDALMNIAEVSNSLLGRDIHMNPSYIGRLRSGARPLPKKHDYVSAICRYLSKNIKKDYQMNALRQLTNIDEDVIADSIQLAIALEEWLLGRRDAADELISAISKLNFNFENPKGFKNLDSSLNKYEEYLYGNEGKRKAVEQFFQKILSADTAQTIYLFSDENMEWLYEDPVFAERWNKMFIEVIKKGNRVKIIHTISRDINEMLEAVNKWIPIYVTGKVEPYFYPKLRDKVFQRTLFIAPGTAAVVSTSIQYDTSHMLNHFIVDETAIKAVWLEYERYLSLCRPLMKIYTETDMEAFFSEFRKMKSLKGDAIFCCKNPPMSAMPEELAGRMSDLREPSKLHQFWKEEKESLLEHLKDRKVSMILKHPEEENEADDLYIPEADIFTEGGEIYTREEYFSFLTYLKKLEEENDNLQICFDKNILDNMILFVKEDTGVIMFKRTQPKAVFVIKERNMIHAFWDYFSNVLNL